MFIATVNNDDDLRIKVAKEWSELNSVEITPEMINCAGCRIEGVKTPFCDSLCPIRQCALGRDVDSFSENTIKVTLPVINIGDNLQSDEKKVYDCLNLIGQSSSEIAASVGYGKNKTLSILTKLEDKGYASKIGNGRGTKYLKKH